MAGAAHYGLRPAERLTLVALLRGWNPRESPVPLARASLEELCAWTGLSKGQQSETIRELLEGWRPAPVNVLAEATRGSARLYGMRVFVEAAVRAAAKRVPRAERIPDALRSAGGTDAFGGRNGRVPPAERKGSAGRTHPSVESPQTLDVKTKDGAQPDLSALTDDELFAIGDKRDARYLAAVIERKRRGLKAVGKGKA